MKSVSFLKKASTTILILLVILLGGCTDNKIKEINIGYIGPLSTRATDLGIAPSKAMKLAIEQYNTARSGNDPKVNFFIEDDQWEKEKALPAYLKLRKEHNIDVLFISNSDGTVAVQKKVLEDNVIVINPLNNDDLLSSLNENTFKIAKSTEDAMGLVALRIIQLKLKKVLILQYPNDFMIRGADAAKTLLDNAGIENKIIEVHKDAIDFVSMLNHFKEKNYDAYVFFGYKEFGFAMKQAREMGIHAPFFGSPGLLNPTYYDNSKGMLIGTEFPFFTAKDGNYILTEKFLTDYKTRFGEKPFSIWAPMHAYDAMGLLLAEIKNVNNKKQETELFGDWLRNTLFNVKHYQGVCGNIAITEDGSSRGIYFSLYRYKAKGEIELVTRD